MSIFVAILTASAASMAVKGAMSGDMQLAMVGTAGAVAGLIFALMEAR